MEHLPENSINKIYGTLARMGLECCQEADESMPAGLEELGEGVDGAGVDSPRSRGRWSVR